MNRISVTLGSLFPPHRCLLLSLLPKTTHSRSDSHRRWCVQSIGSSSLSLVASLALPDSNSRTLHSILSTETAEVLWVLTNFDLFDLLSQTRTITGSVFTHDSNLFRTLRLHQNVNTRVRNSHAIIDVISTNNLKTEERGQKNSNGDATKESCWRLGRLTATHRLLDSPSSPRLTLLCHFYYSMIFLLSI